MDDLSHVLDFFFVHLELALKLIDRGYINSPVVDEIIGRGGDVVCKPWVVPVTRRFRGGKGVATTIGGFSVLCPLAVLAVVAVFVAVAATTRFVSLGSITAACLLPLAMRLLFHAPDPEVAAAAAVTILLVVSHRANIRRLLEGTERRLGRREL